MSVHTHRESMNPRKAGWCDCGWWVGTTKVGLRSRQVETERDITKQAAHGVVDPEPMITQAEARISRFAAKHGQDPFQVRTGLDWRQEALEELVDARNYLCWLVEENLGTDLAFEAMRALQSLLVAHDVLVKWDWQ